VRAILGVRQADRTPEASASASNVMLVVGGATTLDFGRLVSRVAIGDPTIADVKVAGVNELRVQGMGAGKTTLLVWFAEGGRESRVIEVKDSGRADDKIDAMYPEAFKAKAFGDWRRAMILVRQILVLDPRHSGALMIQNEGRTQAREVYLRAYQLKESSPQEALRLFQLVVEMTPPDDETHQKAKSRVAQLQSQ
jgi:hypothetical protein